MLPTCRPASYVVAMALLWACAALPVSAQQPGLSPDFEALPVMTPAEVQKLAGVTPLITLHLKDAPLDALLKELNRQCGIDLVWDVGRRIEEPPQVNVTIEALPLWEAIVEIQRQIKLPLGLRTEQRSWLLTGSPLEDPRASGVAPFLVTAPSVSRTRQARRSLENGTQTSMDRVALSCIITAPFKFPVCGTGEVVLDEVQDDAMRDMRTRVTRYSTIPSASPFQSLASFALEGWGSAQGISRLNATAWLPVADGSEEWEITDIAKAGAATKTVETNLGTMTYSLTPASLTNRGAFQCIIRIGGPALEKLPRSLELQLYHLARFVDAEGVVQRPVTGSSRTIEGPPPQREVSFRMYFDGKPSDKPIKLILNLPRQIKRVGIAFTFKNLKLPAPGNYEPAPEPSTPRRSPTGEVIAPAAPPPPEVPLPALTLNDALQRIGGPALVSLNATNRSLEAVADDLAKQGGVPIGFDPYTRFRLNELRPITLDANGQSFWSVLAAVVWQARLRLSQDSQTGQILLMHPDQMQVATSLRGSIGARGAAVITANAMELGQEALLPYRLPEKARGREYLRLSCTVAIDPKLSITPHTANIRLDEAIDDKGHSLMPAATKSVGLSTPPGNQCLWEQFIELKTDAAGAEKIARLKGVLRFTAVLKRTMWEATDLNKDAGSSYKTIIPYGEEKLTQEYHTHMSRDDRNITIDIGWTNQPSKSTVRHDITVSGEMLRGHVRLFDKEGRAYEVGRTTASRYVPTSADANYQNVSVRFPVVKAGQELGESAKLVVEVPAEVQPVEVPFEFKDLPLP